MKEKILKNMILIIMVIFIYEGEYLNGKKNGKGKEYNQYGKIIFEGEYSNWKRKKGKEYNQYGKIIFEGEYLNGQRWNGKGKEYDLNGSDLLFEEEYLNGQRWNGKGKKYDYDINKMIELEYVNGEIFEK